MRQYRILLIGPIFNTPSGPSGQGGKLFSKFVEDDYFVIKASHFRNKLARFLHTIIIVMKFWRYDIILLQSFGLLAFVMEDVVSRLSVFFNKPIIFTLRGGAFFEFYKKHPKWVRKVLNRATYITSPSYFLSNKFSYEGFKVIYIPNFLDFENFKFKREVENNLTILWVRAFHDIYHPELAIETIKLLKQIYPKIKLTMIGPDQGLLDKCVILIKKYNLEDNIQILGYISNNQLQEFYHKNRTFITTTRYESFGVAIIEAGACGLPCVSTNVGEIPLIWQDNENILLANRDAKDFALKIQKVIEDDFIYEKLSNNAHKNAIKYTWENVKPLWDELIQSINK
jgi:glycosyltransferase involved in cell wall biosynthesis